MDKEFELVIEEISQAQAIVITAGAGMGVDSGLPDFRGNSGFWKEYPAISHLGLSFYDMANPTWFEQKPELAWAFYGHRLNLYRETMPHKGFSKLLEFGQNLPFGYFVYTSNVDGQFQKAGFSDDLIEEIHGSINHFQCTKPCSGDIWEARNTKVNIDKEKFLATDRLPVCPHCGAIARPNILMFGDWNWLPKRSANQAEKFSKWMGKIIEHNANFVIIELGAGKAIPSVRMKSQQLSASHDSFLIRINPRDYDIPKRMKGVEIPMGALDGILRIL